MKKKNYIVIIYRLSRTNFQNHVLKLTQSLVALQYRYVKRLFTFIQSTEHPCFSDRKLEVFHSRTREILKNVEEKYKGEKGLKKRRKKFTKFFSSIIEECPFLNFPHFYSRKPFFFQYFSPFLSSISSFFFHYIEKKNHLP